MMRDPLVALADALAHKNKGRHTIERLKAGRVLIARARQKAA